MYIGEEASSIIGFFGVVDLHLRAGLFFWVSAIFCLFSGLLCILPMYSVVFFWLYMR